LVSDIKGGTYTEGVTVQVLWRILGPKRDEVTEGWRKLHNKLCEFDSFPNKNIMINLRRMLGGACSRNWGEKGTCIGC
jgi:hypothetical protein